MKNKLASTIKYDPLIHSVRTNILIGRAIVEYIRKYPDYSDSADLRIIGKKIFLPGITLPKRKNPSTQKSAKRKGRVKSEPRILRA